VESIPNAGKVCFLAPEFHLGTLAVVRGAEGIELVPNFRGALAAPHHMVVQHIQSFGSVRECLNTRREESAGSITSKAMSTRQTRKARRKSLALAETIRLGEDTGLHLAHQIVRKGRTVWFVLHFHQWSTFVVTGSANRIASSLRRRGTTSIAYAALGV